MTATSTMSYPSYLSPNTLTMFNINNLLNQKDSRWLQLEVCREFQRQKCTRSDAECKFAHPPPNVEVQNGRVTACYDSIKGRCNREKPACKYFHPPQHLKDQLLINGRNHLALKNALVQQMQQHIIPGQIPAVFGAAPYLSASLPLAYNPYLPAGQLVSPLLQPEATPTVVSHAPQATPQPQPQPAPQIHQKQRSDRIEAFPTGNVLPYKRPAAADKSGLPVYQPVAAPAPAPYQQALLQMQPPFVPVTYNSGQPIAIPRYQ